MYNQGDQPKIDIVAEFPHSHFDIFKSLLRERLSMSRGILKDIEITGFKDETQLEDIIGLISNDLSEPYSIYVYRYFIQQWYAAFCNVI